MNPDTSRTHITAIGLLCIALGLVYWQSVTPRFVGIYRENTVVRPEPDMQNVTPSDGDDGTSGGQNSRLGTSPRGQDDDGDGAQPTPSRDDVVPVD